MCVRHKETTSATGKKISRVWRLSVEAKMSSAGGACFTPRLKVRPQYPSAAKVFLHTALSYVRVPVLCVLVSLAVQGLYRSVVSNFLASGWSERSIFVGLSFLVHTGCYTSINGFFFACEKYGWFREYQFDRKPYQIPSDALLRRTFWEAFVSQCITTPVGLWFLYPVFGYFGMPPLLSPLPFFSAVSLLGLHGIRNTWTRPSKLSAHARSRSIR